MHNHSGTQCGGVLPAGVPGTRSLYTGFGRGFYKNVDILTAQHTSSMEREATGRYQSTCGGACPASTAPAGAAGARWRTETCTSKKSGGVSVKVGVKPVRRRRAAPTLLEIHQRVIDAALLEISRPHEGPFENLGERLGGEHETFTYYSQVGGGGDEGTHTELTACGPPRLPESTSAIPRASTATGERRTLARTRDRPRPSTGPRFSTLTADRPRQMDLPRCNEPWKIPLLRTSLTPSHSISSRSIAGDSFGDVEYDVLDGSWLSGSDKDATTSSAAADSTERAPQESTAAGASTPSDDVEEHSADETLTPCAESTASLPIEGRPVSRIAASQYVEEMVSKALLIPIPSAEEGVDNEGNKGQTPAESDALSLDKTSEAGAPASLAAAKHSSALRGAFLVVSDKENLNMEAAEKLQREGARSREQVIASESRVVAQECAREYLRLGLQVRQAGASGASGGGISGSQLQLDTRTTCQHEINGRLSKNMSLVLAQSDDFRKGCHTSDESGSTTPTSGITSRMSCDSSSIEFVLNDDSSSGTCLGDETQLDLRDGTGDDNSPSADREVEALANTATAVVEGWVFSVASKLARATTHQTSAGVKTSPSLISDKHEALQGTTGNAACDSHPPVRHAADVPEGDGPNNHHPGAPLGREMKMLPVGFLNDIVKRRASLKPVAASRPTSASVEEDRRLGLDSRQERERCAQQEAAERASALRDLESLTRAERLDGYDPGAFSRGALYGEGRHSVVYSAYAARPCERGEEEHQDAPGTASTAEATRHAAAAMMVRKTAVEVLTTAVAAGVAAAAVSSVSTVPMVVSTALIESVVLASISAVTATTKTVLAAKEFRFARADVPVSILRKAYREVSMHVRVSGCTHVVALRGVWLTPRVTLLLEPMGGGNLHSFVRHRAAEETARNDKATGKSIQHDNRRPYTSVETAWLVAEAAEGLAALHSAGIVHRDVKSHNVMVAKRQRGVMERSSMVMPGWEAKLGDLGSATLVPPEGHAALTEETGTSGWMAPEVRRLVV